MSHAIFQHGWCKDSFCQKHFLFMILLKLIHHFICFMSKQAPLKFDNRNKVPCCFIQFLWISTTEFETFMRQSSKIYIIISYVYWNMKKFEWPSGWPFIYRWSLLEVFVFRSTFPIWWPPIRRVTRLIDIRG
jgi:hypothetical protein